MMSNKIIISFFVFLHIFTTPLFSIDATDLSRIKFETLSNSQGLSQVTVLSICQDHYGYLWIGTREGLNKYDGYQFKYYKNETDNFNSISSDYISAIFEDEKQRLWIGTDNGLNVYDRENNLFNRYSMPGSNKSGKQNTITCIYGDRENGVLIGTMNGLFSLRANSESYTFLSVSGNQNMAINFIKPTPGLKLLIGSSNGLFQFSKKKLFRLDNVDRKSAFYRIHINDIAFDHRGDIWIATNDGLIHTNANFQQIKTLPTWAVYPGKLSNNNIKSLQFDQNNVLWIGSENGLFLLDVESKELQTFQSQKPDYSGLSNDDINTIYEDQSGVLWIGTNSGGLNKFSWDRLRFSAIEAGLEDGRHLNNKDVYALYEDEDAVLWVGTNRGLNKCILKEDRIEYFLRDKKFQGKLGKIRTIVPAGEHKLWLGTYGGLGLFDTKSGRITRVPIVVGKRKIPPQAIAALCTTGNRDVWIGTKDFGLYFYNRTSEEFISLRHNPDDSASISSDYIRTLLLNDDGTLWVGTYGGGLDLLNPVDHRFKHYKNIPGDRKSLSSNFVYSLYKKSDAELWVGTYGGGINYFNIEAKQFTRFSIEDGLPNDVVYGILSDKFGNLWISSNNGLSQLMLADKANDPAKIEIRAIRTYDTYDGLLSNEFNFGAVFQNQYGVTYFGNTEGLNYFNPEDITLSNESPKIEITGIKVYSSGDEEKFNAIRNVSRANQIELSYHTYLFEISYSALIFNNSQKNLYRYKLDGFDPNWIQPGPGVNHVNYTNLEGGEYIFKIRAISNNGNWTKNTKELKIIIHPPFWVTWWFRTLGVLAILSIILGIHRIRTNRLRREFEGKEKLLVELKEQIEVKKQMEKALQESEEKYRTITDNLKVGIYRSEIASEGKLVEVNPAFLELFGYKNKNEVLNKKIKQFYKNPEDRRGIIEIIIEQGFVEDQILHLKKKKGEDIICSNTSVLVKDKNGVPLFMDGILEDITEKIKTEQALKESEEKYRNFVERGQDGIVILQDSVFKFTNKAFAKMLKVSPKDLLEKPFIQFVHPDYRVKIKEQYAKRMSGEKVDPLYEATLLDNNGNDVFVEINAGIITYGGKSGDLVFIRDLTDRRNLETQFRQMQKMDAIGLLAGGIAHDFNNIITIINGHSELALSELDKNDRAHHLISEVVKSGKRASNLTRQLLAFSRKQVIKPQILNMNTVIANMDKMLRRLIGEDIKMKLILSPEIPEINADPGQMEQIIMNLVINSRDAILSLEDKEKPKLITVETNYSRMKQKVRDELRILHQKEFICISVSDTGIGMDRDLQEKIFNPFFTTKEIGKGTGLGLSTVFGIIKQNGGEIKVNSAPGRGSTFKVYWPIADEKQKEVNKVDNLQLELQGEETILLVEDDPGVRSFARMALQQSGYIIIDAENGKAALNMVEKERPPIDILITDMVMPEMNGHELAEKIRAFYKDIRILFTSGYTDRNIAEDITEKKGVTFLQKPYSAAQLNAIVREMIDQDGQ